MSENLKEQLQAKYDVIVEEIKHLESLRTIKYKTNCQFRYNPGNSYSGLDIDRTQNIEELIHANAFVQYKSEQYHKSADQLEMNERPVFKWCGFEPNDWMHDIKLRLQIITLDSKLSKLRELKGKIQPYLPEENTIKQLLLELNA